MATILIDYENVGNTNGLRGVDVLKDTDTLIIFYSGCCAKIRQDYLQEIRNSGCNFRVVKLKETRKNALDFYIATECGRISENGESQLAIISNDKGFQAVIDYFAVNKELENVQVVRAANVELALTLLNSTGDIDRRKELQYRMQKLDLATECARIEAEHTYRKEIEKLLCGSKYEGRIAEIIDFIEAKKEKGRKKLYTGALHLFGKEDGIAIYRMVKDIEKK